MTTSLSLSSNNTSANVLAKPATTAFIIAPRPSNKTCRHPRNQNRRNTTTNQMSLDAFRGAEISLNHGSMVSGVTQFASLRRSTATIDSTGTVICSVVKKLKLLLHMTKGHKLRARKSISRSKRQKNLLECPAQSWIWTEMTPHALQALSSAKVWISSRQSATILSLVEFWRHETTPPSVMRRFLLLLIQPMNSALGHPSFYVASDFQVAFSHSIYCIKQPSAWSMQMPTIRERKISRSKMRLRRKFWPKWSKKTWYRCSTRVLTTAGRPIKEIFLISWDSLSIKSTVSTTR